MSVPADKAPILSRTEWITEAARRFGPDPLDWRFVCPSCGHVASVRDWKDAGAPESAAAFSCVGRWTGRMGVSLWTKPGPCNYAGFGLFQINPVAVDHDGVIHCVFAFADVEAQAEEGGPK